LREAREKSIADDLARFADPWSFIGKYMPRKLKTDYVAATLNLPDGQVTTNVGETVRALFQKFFPSDNEDDDIAAHKEVRAMVRNYRSEVTDRPFTQEELEEEFRKYKRKKAPGLDGITTEVLKKIWNYVAPAILQVMNKALAERVFPAKWKGGKLSIIPKANQADPSSIKSYRPLTMLPLIGKLLEMLILSRFQPHIDATGLISERQYGFTSGKSTVDALFDIVQEVKSSDEKYVVAK